MENRRKKPLKEYKYLTRIKVELMVITCLIALFVPIAIWDGGKYLVAFAVGCIALAFAFITWQDSHDKVTLYNDCLVQEKGAGPFRRVYTLKWGEVAYLKDETKLFSMGRSYYVKNDGVKGEKPVKIRINSSLGDYRELLASVIRLSPNLVIDGRAEKMLAKMGIEYKKRK
ncbi:MAG: hypothetical protein VB085_01925 [Peptococcaceae bacterium]|nr:hypothetical protein [Peptococcaceae bacterium]